MSAFETMALILDSAALSDQRMIQALLWLGLPPAEYQVAAVTQTLEIAPISCPAIETARISTG